MPKETRKARRAKKAKPAPPPPAPVEKIPAEVFAEPVLWGVELKTVVRCPCCGRVGELSYTSRSGVTVGISDGPYELEVSLQRFGGSMPSPTGAMKDRPGYIEYVPAPQLREEYLAMVREKLQAALDLLGD
jgi:hypothetical protein